jgi:hypothetical protein
MKAQMRVKGRQTLEKGLICPQYDLPVISGYLLKGH